MGALFSLFKFMSLRGIFSIITRLPQYLSLSWRLMLDPRTPKIPKTLVILAVLYGLSPLDIIPEAILPHFGFGEDILIIILSLRNLIAKSPPDLVKEHARDIAQKS